MKSVLFSLVLATSLSASADVQDDIKAELRNLNAEKLCATSDYEVSDEHDYTIECDPGQDVLQAGHGDYLKNSVPRNAPTPTALKLETVKSLVVRTGTFEMVNDSNTALGYETQYTLAQGNKIVGLLTIIYKVNGQLAFLNFMPLGK